MESRFIALGDARIHYRHRPGSGSPLLFFHATGFHAGIWKQVIDGLPGRDIYLMDMPGHGQSSAPSLPFRWDQVGELMTEAVRQLGLKDITGVGHSMGGHVMLLVASAFAERFRQLVLLDPVVIPLKAIPFMNGFDTSALARRRNRWTSSDAFFDAYRTRAPFDTWEPAVLRDYADGALKPADDGDAFELACDPQLEASVYQNHGAGHLHECFNAITCPVHIIRARSLSPGDSPTDFRQSPTAPTLVNKLSLATDEQHTDFTHFFPMEQPAWVSEKIASYLG